MSIGKCISKMELKINIQPKSMTLLTKVWCALNLTVNKVNIILKHI